MRPLFSADAGETAGGPHSEGFGAQWQRQGVDGGASLSGGARLWPHAAQSPAFSPQDGGAHCARSPFLRFIDWREAVRGDNSVQRPEAVQMRQLRLRSGTRCRDRETAGRTATVVVMSDSSARVAVACAQTQVAVLQLFLVTAVKAGAYERLSTFFSANGERLLQVCIEVEIALRLILS